MSKEIVDDLIKITGKKKIHLETILDITKKQQQVIRDGNIDGLFKYIEQKQDHIEHINKLDSMFLDKYSIFKKINNVRSLEKLNFDDCPALKGLKNLVEDIGQLLNEIKENEAINNKEIGASFDKVKEELKNIKTGKKLVNGYGAYDRKEGSIFIDTEG